MNKAKEKLNITIEQNEQRNKELIEHNKILLKELNQLEDELTEKEKKKKGLNNEINNKSQ